ncbi:MAG: glycine-rich domain-containing protein [Sphingomonas sp.]
MSDSAFLPVSYPGHPVWIALSRHTIGPDDAALSFAQRLARENGWNAAHAARVFEEYRRFCFLAVVARHQVTPSDAVDQAWHLHLTYSRDYWDHFCPDVLGRPLHHGPTAGGAAEQARYFAQYADTLKSYEAVFGDSPPADLWPSATRRLNDDPRARRVHPRDGIVLSKFILIALLALAALAGGVCVQLWQGTSSWG